ncbi:MAG: hypothetical protein J7L72_09020 [Candidatus Aminicenantes bacterium]|nr:hypothetical protein [Candidatus Aminicenantes bacterium]HHF51182.1 hypothetical protein [Candidatus Aminicenantes bacterium]
MKKIKEIKDLAKEELLDLLKDASKNWLAHDGLWFQAVEKELGMETAIELDRRAWEKFTVIEARRIMKRLDIKPGGGIPALIQALKFRLYANINVQEITEQSPTHCIFNMNKCRVQDARKRRGLPDFPCKPVGIVEYSGFAQTIDPRIETECLYCPPDTHPPDIMCSWKFTLKS